MNYFLTSERLEELKKEFEYLKTEKRMEISERLKRAKELGDLSENSEYFDARDAQAQVEARIAELEQIIKNAVIIKKGSIRDTVGIGSTVEVAKNGEVMKFAIVGSNETRPEEGLISNESPLGQALLGRKVGDSVKVKTPTGRHLEYQVIKVE